MGSLRRILVDARTPVNYVMVRPVQAAMAGDPRVGFSFIASEDPARASAIFSDAGQAASILSPLGAALQKFDAYLTSDFMWTPLPRGTRRIQMFHGVGGKYGFDAPTESLRAWHRLFFVNRRRLDNCVAAGAVDAGSPALRLVGMPKVDCLVDGSLQRDRVLSELRLAPERPTVLYAPTWSPASSLNTLGLELLARLARLPINLIVKLHDRSCDPRERYSGGVDWPAAVRRVLPAGRGVLAAEADICPCLAAADVMITDHSSAGFEYLLLDRPLVRIHLPELIRTAQVHPDYVQLLSDVAESANDPTQIVAAVERALVDPSARSASRRAVAADLFHAPGTATARCVAELYDVLELDPPVVALESPEAPDSRAAAPDSRAAALDSRVARPFQGRHSRTDADPEKGPTPQVHAGR